ncbi:hypothetical protein KDL44_15190 [bacterium]|nr:hypothetical protein [bacterium]
MDQNIMILIIVAVAFSFVTLAILLMKLPKRILLVWSVFEGLIFFLLILWMYILPGQG